MHFEPQTHHGFRSWSQSLGSVEVLFAGKGPALSRPQTLRTLLPEDVEPAWLKQAHSASVRTARPGSSGDGDALVTDRSALALTVVTADCVPILLAVHEGGAAVRLAAVHAGWRGLVQRIVAATLARLDAPGSAVTAWIGPAIGPCCYEVGDDVARQVAAASSGDILRPGRRGRPHLDLVAAAREQLRQGGVRDVRQVVACTRCDEDRLWSYRRDGAAAGRNVAAIWWRPPPF